MSTAAQVALVISVVIAVASVLGVAWAIARTSAKTQTDTLYEKENTILGKALARAETEVGRLQAKTDTLQNTVTVLEGTVSGSEAVKKLAAEIAAEEGKRREEHQTMMVLLKDIIAELRQSRGAIGR